MIDTTLLLERLGARFGHDLSVEPEGDIGHVAIRVPGLPPPDGFRLILSSGWRSMEAVFSPDPFASRLMKTLCSDDPQRRKEFAALASTFGVAGVTNSVRVDEKSVNPNSLPEGPWSKVEISCIRLTDKSDEQGDAERVASASLALVLSLLPVEREAVEISPLAQGLPEGALVRLAVNRYERSPSNRAAAIAVHGAYCHACGFDFSAFYGTLGDGFIEVHHRVPVSRLGEGYVIDPSRDLVPLCANCHQMVHRDDPPIPPEDLRGLLVTRGVIR